MNYSKIVTYNGFNYRLGHSDKYGFGLESRPLPIMGHVADNWTDVDLMPKGEVETVMKDILGISTE